MSYTTPLEQIELRAVQATLKALEKAGVLRYDPVNKSYQSRAGFWTEESITRRIGEQLGHGK